MPSDRRTTKTATFLREKARLRKLPGHCSHCGRPNPNPVREGTLHGQCSACREWQRQWKARRKGKPAQPPVQTVIVDPATFYHFEERVRDLERQIKDMKNYARAEYRRGVRRGIYTENIKWRKMPSDWDSWREKVGIEEGKRQFTALAMATGG